MSGQYHRGLLALKKCAKKFVFDANNHTNNSPEDEHISVSQVNENNSRSNTPRILSPASPGSYIGFFNSFMRADSNPERNSREVEESQFNQQLEKEINLFSNAIQFNRGEILHKTKHSSDFWLKREQNNQLVYPILSNLALIFNCIPSSSASIERYFSTCGYVIKKNAGNIGIDLFIARCLIKSNLDIIKNLDEFDY